MLDHLLKFQQLDSKLREAVSGEAAMKAVAELESEYGISLADLIIRLMVKEVQLAAVPALFVADFKLEIEQADKLYQAMRNGVLRPVLDYLEGVATPAAQADSKQAADAAETFTVLEQPTEKKTATFIIDPEDEAEARHHAVKVSVIEPSAGFDVDIEAIVNELNLSFASEALMNRLKSVISTYMRGVRNKVDTKLFLTKAVGEGGVQLDAEVADQVLSKADLRMNSGRPSASAPSNRPKVAVPEDAVTGLAGMSGLKALGARDIDYDFTASLERAGKAKAGPESIGQVDPYAWRRPKEAVGKVAMADVKVQAPKVMNALDELRYFDLVIFRRMSRNPEEATAKIKEKIALLELESYQKRLAGIQAWRQSPLHSLYLRVGEEAMKLGQGVEAVLDSHQADKENLSVAEFVAIMKLNKELRF